MKPLRYLAESFRQLQHARTEWERKEMLRLIEKTLDGGGGGGASGNAGGQERRTTQPPCEAGARDADYQIAEIPEPETIVETRNSQLPKLSTLAQRIIDRWVGGKLTSRAIARACGIAEGGTLRAALRELMEQGIVERESKGVYFRLKND